MIRFKPNVLMHKKTPSMPEMWRILDIAESEAPAGYTVTVTSGCEGKHTPGSSHYQGKAFDIRTRDFPENVRKWSERIGRALGNRYFVLLEPDHIHIQWNG